jgi:hypothetical protein
MAEGLLAVGIRPDEWELPLFLHILSAMFAVGALMLSVVSLAAAWSNGSAALTRLGFRALLWGALPSYVVLRGSSQWIADKEGLEDSEAAWIEIGFMATDPGSLLLIAATVLGGLASRRAAEPQTGPLVTARVATGLVSVLLVLYLVAVWAMTTKPV